MNKYEDVFPVISKILYSAYAVIEARKRVEKIKKEAMGVKSILG